MYKKAVQENVIHSFKPTSTMEIYGKWGKGACEFCDEQLKAMFIFNQGMKDEPTILVYHKITVEAENVEDVNLQEPRDKVGDQERLKYHFKNQIWMENVRLNSQYLVRKLRTKREKEERQRTQKGKK